MTVNWNDISKEPTLSESFLIENKHKINWTVASAHQHFTEECMEQLLEEGLLHWDALSRNPCLSERLIEKYRFEVNWYHIMKYQNLSLSFLQKYEHKIDFLSLSYNPFVTKNEKILRFYQDRVCWSDIFSHTHLRESFIRKIIGNLSWVDWTVISKHQIISKAFIQRHIKKICIASLEENEHLSFTKEELQELESLQTAMNTI